MYRNKKCGVLLKQHITYVNIATSVVSATAAVHVNIIPSLFVLQHQGWISKQHNIKQKRMENCSYNCIYICAIEHVCDH